MITPGPPGASRSGPKWPRPFSFVSLILTLSIPNWPTSQTAVRKSSPMLSLATGFACLGHPSKMALVQSQDTRSEILHHLQWQVPGTDIQMLQADDLANPIMAWLLTALMDKTPVNWTHICIHWCSTITPAFILLISNLHSPESSGSRITSRASTSSTPCTLKPLQQTQNTASRGCRNWCNPTH